MTDNTSRISAGYGRPDPFSPASLKEARKQRDATRRFETRADFETALAWRSSGDPRYTGLPAQTKIALALYESDRKAAHEGTDR